MSPSQVHPEPTWFDDVVEVAPAPTHEHVVVRLGAGRYGLPADGVVEVVPVPPLTRVPGAPGWLLGVGNWRGHVLPLVDLRPVLGIPATPLASSARVVVLRADDVEAGIVTDQVLGLLEVPDEHEPAPVTLPPAAAALVGGVVDDGSASGPVALLVSEAVLTLAGPASRSR